MEVPPPVIVSDTASELTIKRISATNYTVTTSPCDSYGNYLGPGYSVTAVVKNPTSIREVVLDDLLDGTYSGLVTLTSQETENDASISVMANGTEITNRKKTHRLKILLILFLCLVLVLILVVLKRKPK